MAVVVVLEPVTVLPMMGASVPLYLFDDIMKVPVIGLGLPNDNKPYVHEGITDCVILWNSMDLGYLAVVASDALVRGELKPGDTSFHAGRLGTLKIRGDNILLGEPFRFTRENIDQFDF